MRRPPRIALGAALALGIASAPAVARADEAGEVSATRGAVMATASWRAADVGAADPRLTIVRGGTTLFDGSPVAGTAACRQGGCSFAASGRRASPLQVRDLDGDGEPEVLLDVYTGGAHCCALTEVFRFVPDAAGAGAYVVGELTWGNSGYGLRDLDGDGPPEFVVELVLAHYFRQCALQMSCRDLALAGGFLARHGLRRDGTRLLSRSDAKRINAVMLTCGTYDAAGEVAYRVGLPAKSGVGGGILAVIPNRCTLCAWGPGLDEAGNSVVALEALDAFTTRSGWSVF